MYERSLKVKKELIKSIREKELQLAKLRAHIDKSTVCSDLYNKVVLEKAILKKELEDSNKNSFMERVRNLEKKKKTLICDYFRK